ncbi:Uncharacterized protein TCM_026830 [Theobroma cacao]|uniref:Uncharacterized protein n=1 Tax=Theobroma cacao TaxID=3641 RepID=A0A061FBA1_THECC|nr:Uncharacterized protein TCM_026830 [Theobroma cacao]
MPCIPAHCVWTATLHPLPTFCNSVATPRFPLPKLDLSYMHFSTSCFLPTFQPERTILAMFCFEFCPGEPGWLLHCNIGYHPLNLMQGSIYQNQYNQRLNLSFLFILLGC